MKIGFVGLGRMGMAMVYHLLEKGVDVVAYNRTHEKVDVLLEEFRIHPPAGGSEFSGKNGDYISLSEFGSRGEQRLAVLWLKLAELSYIEKITGDKPVLLLDDILSELDHPHRHAIFSIMRGQQTILTMTDRHFIEKDQLEDAKIIELK